MIMSGDISSRRTVLVVMDDAVKIPFLCGVFAFFLSFYFKEIFSNYTISLTNGKML